ncbi:hypothetical protein XENOCAPTIV_024491, partial [Xenoophorus captivus]
MRITSERAEDLDEAFCLRRPLVLMGFPDLKLTPAGQPGKLVTQCSQWTYTASLLGFHAHISFHSYAELQSLFSQRFSGLLKEHSVIFVCFPSQVVEAMEQINKQPR